MTIIFEYPVPVSLDGAGLEAELTVAGFEGRVSVSGGVLQVVGEFVEADRSPVGTVVAAHSGQPTQADASRQVRVVDASSALDALIAQFGAAQIRQKCKAVLFNGGTFTNRQRDIAVSVLLLDAISDRSDT